MDPNARAERRFGVIIPGGTTQSHYNLIPHQKSDLFLIIQYPKPSISLHISQTQTSKPVF